MTRPLSEAGRQAAEMAIQGTPPYKISAKLNITREQVHSYLSLARQHGYEVPYFHCQVDGRPPPRNSGWRGIRIPSDMAERLDTAAAKRGTDAGDLVRKLVEIVDSDNLWPALLDD